MAADRVEALVRLGVDTGDEEAGDRRDRPRVSPRLDEALEAKGASKQWCLWASTSTKNPAYRDVLYVEELIGPEVVNTMPLETVQAFQDHGEVRDTLAEGLDEARELLDQLAEAGIDYDDVVATLEDEGVQKFSDSFGELLAGIQDKLATVGAR